MDWLSQMTVHYDRCVVQGSAIIRGFGGKCIHSFMEFHLMKMYQYYFDVDFEINCLKFLKYYYHPFERENMSQTWRISDSLFLWFGIVKSCKWNWDLSAKLSHWISGAHTRWQPLWGANSLVTWVQSKLQGSLLLMSLDSLIKMWRNLALSLDTLVAYFVTHQARITRTYFHYIIFFSEICHKTGRETFYLQEKSQVGESVASDNNHHCWTRPFHFHPIHHILSPWRLVIWNLPLLQCCVSINRWLWRLCR